MPEHAARSILIGYTQVILVLFEVGCVAAAATAIAAIRAEKVIVYERRLLSWLIIPAALLLGMLAGSVTLTLAGAIATGPVIGWAAYVLAAERFGLFEIVRERTEPPEQRTATAAAED